MGLSVNVMEDAQRKLLVGVANQLVQLCKLVIDINESGYGDEAFEYVISSPGKYDLCGAVVTVTPDGVFLIEKGCIYIVLPMYEAKKFESFQSLIYDYEIGVNILKKYGLVQEDKSENPITNVFELLEFATTVKCWMQDELTEVPTVCKK